MSDPISAHCDQIDRCNQRGGRMLSIVDLIHAGTIAPDLAAYALAAIGGGASFMVGALPGGAGKTTVMGALLNFVPADVSLHAADGMEAIEEGLRGRDPRCYICHEISRGGGGEFYAYLAGEELRRYFDLPMAGHMLATNLHADTFDQARRQVCGDHGVADAAFWRMNLIFFLSVTRSSRGATRRVVEVWESDGRSPHERIFATGKLTAGHLASTGQQERAADALDAVLASGEATIEAVRLRIVAARRR